MPGLESHWLAEILVYLDRSLSRDAVWRRKASDTFPRLKYDPKGEAPFVPECQAALRKLLGSIDLSLPCKESYQEQVVSPASDALRERQGWTTEEIHFHGNWVPGSGFLNNS